MDNYIGRLLDNRYEILEQIGSGGMAVVYKARCHRLNRLVAIKILKDELGQDEEFRRRFHAESQAVAMLSHHNIVNVYDVSHSENLNYIVMELIDGITLKQYLQQKGALNWREVLHFSTQIAKALEHAHSRGIIHRDIKPHNIMILKDGTVKVADFGIARVSSAQSTLTREALGSVHYISPEQAKGGKIDYRSDIYSLGVVMYEMLTGRTPYDGETPVSVAIQHINANAVLPRTINPQIPIGLEQITMHAMEANVDKRYETATDLICDLEEFRRNPNIMFETDNENRTSHPVEHMVRQPSVHAEPHVSSSKKRKTVRPMNTRKSNLAGLVAGILCIVLALSFIGYFLYSFFFSDLLNQKAEIAVPPLVGQLEADIDPNDYPEFRIQVDRRLPSENAPIGEILNQEPSAGNMVKNGAIISLTVSSGPSTDSMRDLINYTAQNATTILNNLGLNLHIREVKESSDTIVSGAVIRTDPAKDAVLTNGQEVILYVSSGPNIVLVPVPELVGKKIDAATAELDELKLKYGISYVDSDTAEGTVIFQSIKQMEKVKEGTTINLQVSNGPTTPKENEENPEDGRDPILSQKDPKVIMIPMPKSDRNQTIQVTVKIDDVVIQDSPVELITISDKGLPIAPDINGVHDIDVYIDGVLWYSMTYDFDTGEQLQ